MHEAIHSLGGIYRSQLGPSRKRHENFRYLIHVEVIYLTTRPTATSYQTLCNKTMGRCHIYYDVDLKRCSKLACAWEQLICNHMQAVCFLIFLYSGSSRRLSNKYDFPLVARSSLVT